MKSIFKRFNQWRLRWKLQKARNVFKKRLNNLPLEERAELLKKAREVAFPSGYWSCQHDMVEVSVANGEKCPFCGRGGL